jgi:hypothetical protein
VLSVDCLWFPIECLDIFFKKSRPLNFKNCFWASLYTLIWLDQLIKRPLQNCVVAVRYMRYTCDSSMWRYGITGIAHVTLRCKFIQAFWVRNNPAQGFKWFAAERYMRYNSDNVALHAVFTSIAESYKESKICSGMSVLIALWWVISLCGFPLSLL